MLNYPLKFTSILKEKIWGGTKLVTQLAKESELSRIGESWEISAVEENISIVKNGNFRGKSLSELLKTYTSKLVGKNNYTIFGEKFPLLIKFIDAKQDLSIQVHPNNELAKSRHNSFGKTEMWYVMQADEDSKLILGFKESISSKQYKKLLADNQIMSVLQDVYVNKGDVFLIEPGTIHTIGAGIVLAEIQQTSDITYRIYDFERVDSAGNKREIHAELSVEALNFRSIVSSKKAYENKLNKLNKVVTCNYFKTNFIPICGEVILDYSQLDSFVIFICVEGNAEIKIFNSSESIKFGETMLIPAVAKKVLIVSENCKLLEVTV